VHEFCSAYAAPPREGGRTNSGTYLSGRFGGKNRTLSTGGIPKTLKGKSAMNVQCSTRISGVLAALLLALAAFPSSAHHSAAVFDMTKKISMHGTVEKWLWANPHSWLYLRVEKADGSQEVWAFEGGSTGMLARSGWNAADMKPGDKVTVSGSPDRSGSHIALMGEVQLATGRMLKAAAGAPPPGAGAPPPGGAIDAPSPR
jgi:Family of unknown function (DUF6152)